MKSKILFLILCVASVGGVAYAATGTIDTSVTNHAKVCHDVECSSPTPGIINFELSNEPSITVDSVTGISGRVWGNELGWINMNPTGAGVSFADPSTGVLTGKAWSQVSGWVNFAVTGQEVTIDPTTGEFSGWAWTGGPYGGWIKFDCSNDATCVKTTWRGESDEGSGGSSGGGSVGGGDAGGAGDAGGLDVCSNIPEKQLSIPTGYTVDVNGLCVELLDKCPNLNGIQKSLPKGYSVNSLGMCLAKSVDQCHNIDGVQVEVPSDYTVDNEGDCIKPVTVVDQCANLAGIQEAVPKNFSKVDGNCFFVNESATSATPPPTGPGIIEKVTTGVAKVLNAVISPVINLIVGILNVIKSIFSFFGF